jgi:hypothetical protein
MLEGNMNFYKIFAIALLSVGTISCSSCAKKNPDPVVVTVDASPPDAGAPDVAPKPDLTIKGDKWEFTVPSEGWKPMENSPPHSNGYLNADKKNLILVINEPFTGSFDEYALGSIRAMRLSGVQIVSAKSVEVNGTKFVLVESSKDGIRVWAWVTTKDGRGFGFTCGGPEDVNQHDLCFGVANTFKIN